MRRLQPSHFTSALPLTIGRSEANDIVIADDSISRVHLIVSRLRSGRVLITDCQTTNGTRVMEAGSERSVHQAVVETATLLQCGQIRFRLTEILSRSQSKTAGEA
ncbi:MAG: FHA domain-containing protein [bacterium]|nr:FHA domain-containing protein [bacterium]